MKILLVIQSFSCHEEVGDLRGSLTSSWQIHSILNMQEIFGEVPCYPKKPFSNKIRCSMLFKINFLSIFYSIEQEKIKMF